VAGFDRPTHDAQECIVKKKVQMSGGEAFLGSRPGVPSLAEECEKGAGKESWAGRSSACRRPAKAAAERVPVWNIPTETVLVGANVLLREGLARILSSAHFNIVASTFCADDHVLNTLAQNHPILLVIDVSDDFDARLKQIESFKRRYPGGRVVVLADQYELTEIVSAFRVGANTYLAEVSTCEAFIKSLELVMLGVTFLPPEILTLISNQRAGNRNGCGIEAGHADDDGGENVEMVGADSGMNRWVAPPGGTYASLLSARQRSILRCLVQGDSNKIIARKMAMAEATVKVHVKAILRKVRVHNRTQAAIWAMSNGSFTQATDDALPALEEPPVEPFPDLDLTQVPAAGRANGATSLSRLELEGAGHIAMLDNLHLVRKNG
jgi:two-component system, NarL family, nitrate/nitrite response regulator NarL